MFSLLNMIGSSIAHYKVTAKIGAGGMGDVYRATDSKLGRDVALKVLPEAFAADAQRMARFQREAQVLASLNHPNIAGIYGLEHRDNVQALAMELVEGPTLAERIAQSAIPLDEALPIAKQIAEALEYAHEHGVIHRDLKPSNIKLTKDGIVKVLDFGLAKALSEETAAQELSNSPTLSMAATKAGIILGTAAYMSPEQARGKSADRRADIWSFGVVLYEMLTGTRAFAGEDISVTLANVIKEDPDWKKLPASMPGRIRELMQRCLVKDPRQRLQAIGEARIFIEKVDKETEQSPVGAPAAAKSAAVPWAIATILFTVAGILSWKLLHQESAFLPTRRFTIALPQGQAFFGPNPVINVSPDGSQVVYGGSSLTGVGWRLIVRSADEGTPRELPGEDGSVPFFSWDGEWVGYFTPGKLKKIRLNGGIPETLADVRASWGASWGPNDVIVYSPDFIGGLWKVSAKGGTPTKIERKGPVSFMQRWPNVLPDGKHVLCAEIPVGTGSFDVSKVTSISIDTGEAKVLIEGTSPKYVSSGHIVFARSGALYAVPFDMQRQEITGEPVQVISNVRVSSDGIAYFSVSREGTLVYLPSTSGVEDLANLVRVDRKGKDENISAESRSYTSIRLSPDGKNLAARIGDRNTDVWVYSLARGSLSRLTFQTGEDESPVWSSDGKKIAYSSQLSDGRSIFWKNADGSGVEELLWKGGTHTHVSSISPGNKYLLFTDYATAGRGDIWVLPLQGERKPQPFLQSSFSEFDGRFSPDGKWIAYSSDESGQGEVYVTAFPGLGGKWQVSTGGADSPVWSPNGRELFFRSQKKIMKVDVTTSPSFSLSPPKPLFGSMISELARREANYDVFPDGQHFIAVKASQLRSTEYRVVLNWGEELKRVAPPGKK